ncbi:MAG: PEP-CTERM sorting domain-containing protein [Chthoniobacterales bacterium]
MNKKDRSRKFTAKQSARLGAYLAAGVATSMATSTDAEAAIVMIDIGPSGFNIGGVNAGLSAGGSFNALNFPFVGGGTLRLRNGASNMFWGLELYSDYFGPGQIANGNANATPLMLSAGATIDASLNFGGYGPTFFRVDFPWVPTTFISPDFGPGSYLGFRTSDSRFGYLEVTWDSTLSQFEILSGAYESDPNVAILAGAGPAAVPEPGTWAAAALLAGGATFLRWRRRRGEAQKEAA